MDSDSLWVKISSSHVHFFKEHVSSDKPYAKEIFLQTLGFPVDGNMLLLGKRSYIPSPDRDYLRQWVYEHQQLNPNFSKEMVFFRLDKNHQINGVTPHYRKLKEGSGSFFALVPVQNTQGDMFFHVYVALDHLNFKACQFPDEDGKPMEFLIRPYDAKRPGLVQYLVDAAHMGFCLAPFEPGASDASLDLFAQKFSDDTHKELFNELLDKVQTINRASLSAAALSASDAMFSGYSQLVQKDFYNRLAVFYDFTDLSPGEPPFFSDSEKDISKRAKEIETIRNYTLPDDLQAILDEDGRDYSLLVKDHAAQLVALFLEMRIKLRQQTAEDDKSYRNILAPEYARQKAEAETAAKNKAASEAEMGDSGH